MKFAVLILAVICSALTGCFQPKAAPPAAQKPCLPSVTEEMKPGAHPAAIKERATSTEASWDETHTVECATNESTVLPSVRMFVYAGERFNYGNEYNKWLAEHTYCQPDRFQEGKSATSHP